MRDEKRARSASRPRVRSKMPSKSVQVSAVDLPGVGIGWGAAGGATLRDLGVEDKKKVAKLINQVSPRSASRSVPVALRGDVVYI